MTLAVWQRTLLMGLLVLAAGAALLTARPAAAYVTRPDLQISATDWSYGGNPEHGGPHTVKVTVRNPREWDGELRREYGAPASGVKVQYTAPVYEVVQSVSATGGFSCTFAGRVVMCTGGSIANGGYATITVVSSPVYPPGADSGVACVPQHTAVVDLANTIVERDELNNTFTKSFFNIWCIG
jgi:hypothetical protein